MEKAEKTSPAARRWAGCLLVGVAAVMWSTSGLFAKAPTFDGWPGGVLAFWRAAFALVVLLPFVRRPRWKIQMLPMVVIFAIMNFTFLTAMAMTEAANAIWLQHTAPVWVFLGSAFWFREHVKRAEWLLLAFAAAGVGLILFNEFQGASPGGVVYGLLAGLTYAGVVLSLRGLRNEDSFWLISINFAVTTIVLAPYALMQDVWPSGAQWGYLAGFGILQMGIPYVLFARGVQRITSHEASGIVLLEPVLVPVWVFVAWHNHADYEAPRWWTLVGGGLILAGLLVRYIADSRGRVRIAET